jgi:hypothetical protein
VTRAQRRALANLVLLHGYDNVLEFYGELIDGAPDPSTYPPVEEVRPVLFAWHQHIIALADKAK